MLIFLYGENSYLARKQLQKIIASAEKAHPNGFFVRYIDCVGENAQSAADEIWQAELVAPRRLTVFKNVFQNKNLAARLAEKGAALLKLKEAVVFYEEGLPAAKDPFFLFLKKNAAVQEFTAFRNRELELWARGEFKKYGAAIEVDALACLLGPGPSDPRFLENEIKKLAAFKRGQKIQLRDVQFLCRRSPASEIFKALDALSVGNKKKAAELLHHGVRSGDSPLYILSMVVYQLRNMLAVKELVERGKIKTAIIKETGLHPYVAQKTIACAGYFPLIKLKKIYQGLLRVDMGVKTGKLSPETALDILISRIN